MLKVLQSKDPYAFRYAALALAAIGEAAGQPTVDELSLHLDSDNGEILTHALVALRRVGGTLTDETIGKLMDFAFVTDPYAITVCLPGYPSTPLPQFKCVHYVSYLAAKSLTARPDQCLDRRNPCS